MRSRQTVPRPASDSTSMVPPMASMLVLTTSMPTPRPETLVTAAAVENPGRKISCRMSAGLIRSSCGGGDQAALDGLAAELGRVDAGAVVGDLDHDLAALVAGPQGQHALGRLAGGLAGVRGLDAVVDRVADEVGQRVLDRLEQGLVELGLAALHLQADGLLQLHAQVADDARQLGPDVVDRLHARLHDALLQLAGDQVQPLGGADQVRVGLPGDVLHDLVAGQHQLADEQHQLVEQVDVHADRAVGDGAARLAVLVDRARSRRRRVGGVVRGDSSGIGCGGGSLGELGARTGASRSAGISSTGAAAAGAGVGAGGRSARAGAFAARRLLRGGGGLRGRGLLAPGPSSRGPSSPGPSPRGRLADARGARDLGRGAAGASSMAAVIAATTAETSTGPSPPLASIEVSSDADGVDHLQQHAGAGRGQRQLAVPQPGEHVLPDVRDLLEPVEGQEAAGALDRVDRPEDAGQPLAGVGVLLEGDQVGVQLVEVLVTLDQELLDDVVQTVHGCCLLSRVRDRAAGSPGWVIGAAPAESRWTPPAPAVCSLIGTRRRRTGPRRGTRFSR